MSRIKPQICLKYGNEFFSFRQKYVNDIECPECRQTTKVFGDFEEDGLKPGVGIRVGPRKMRLKLTMIPKKELDALPKKVKKIVFQAV